MEQVPVPRELYAGLPRRIVAYVLDSVFVMLVWFALLIALAAANGGSLSGDGAPVILSLVATWAVWDIAWIAGPGRGKPGQRIAGFHVVGSDGERLPVARAAARTATKGLYYVSLGAAGLITLVTVAKSPLARSLHDMVAGSVCIERRGLDLLASPQGHAAVIADTPLQPEATPFPAPLDGSADRQSGPFL